MPIYEYLCRNCGERVEVLVRPSTLRQAQDTAQAAARPVALNAAALCRRSSSPSPT